MMKTDRLVSITVGTEGDHDWFTTFGEMSELARNMGASHAYVSISSSTLGDDDEAEDEDVQDDEGLYYDENTLDKVREAIVTSGFTDTNAHDIISAVLNAGIVFRERR